MLCMQRKVLGVWVLLIHKKLVYINEIVVTHETLCYNQHMNKYKIAIVSNCTTHKYLFVSVYSIKRHRFLKCRDLFTRDSYKCGVVSNYSQRFDCECYFIDEIRFTEDVTTLSQELEAYIRLAGKRYISPTDLYNDLFGDNNE